MASDPFIVAVFFGFVPAMGFLYIVLREYTSLFSEKTMFRTFFIGMVMGAVVALMEYFMSPVVAGVSGADPSKPGTLAALVAFALLLGLLEALAFASVLNWRTFRGRRDTPFYGTAFGLGFGCTSALFLMFVFLQLGALSGAGTLREALVRAGLLAVFGVYVCGAILGHGAMGAVIGRGAARQALRNDVLRAAGIRAAFVVGLYGILLPKPFALIDDAIALASAVFGTVLIGRAMRNVLDLVVPPEVLREMGIHDRRVARRVLRDDQTNR